MHTVKQTLCRTVINGYIHFCLLLAATKGGSLLTQGLFSLGRVANGNRYHVITDLKTICLQHGLGCCILSTAKPTGYYTGNGKAYWSSHCVQQSTLVTTQETAKHTGQHTVKNNVYWMPHSKWQRILVTTLNSKTYWLPVLYTDIGKPYWSPH